MDKFLFFFFLIFFFNTIKYIYTIFYTEIYWVEGKKSIINQFFDFCFNYGFGHPVLRTLSLVKADAVFVIGLLTELTS